MTEPRPSVREDGVSTPLASIIIPTCNRPDYLAACLNLLKGQIPGDGSVEVLVCDDGDTKDTKELLAKDFPQVRWCQGPRVGPAGNRNQGAREAHGRWLIFIDDDCLPHSSLLSAYLTYMAANRDARVILEGPTYCPEGLRSLLWESPYNPDGGKLPSCNFAVPRSLFLEADGFDERYYPAFEDMEFFARLVAQGIQARFIRDAAVDHGPRLIPSPQKMAKRWEVRVTYAYDLGAKPHEVLWRLPVHVAKVILSRFRRAEFKGDDIRAALCFSAEYFFVLAQLPSWLRKHWMESRSRFWKEQAVAGKTHSSYGF